jgi:RimJ/RimL family protein N-acetyltransferase
VSNVKLRKILPGDAQARADLGFDPDILIGFGVSLSTPAPMELTKAEGWIGQISKHPYAWIIENDGRLVGEIRLDQVNFDDQRASLAIAIVDPTKVGQGIGRAAILQCIKIAFEDMKLHRLSVRVLASNLRAIRCYEACGFKREGVEREAALTDWGREDDVMMGLLASERF